MNSTLPKLLLFCVVLFTITSIAQNKSIKKADKLYEMHQIPEAIKLYKQVINSGHTSEEVFKKIGNAYYFISEFFEACGFYKSLFDLNPNQDKESYFRYSQCLKSIGEYEKAEEIENIFIQNHKDDSRTALLKKHSNYKEKISANSGRYIIKDLDINTPYSDHGGAFYNGNLVFSSGREDKWERTNTDLTNLPSEYPTDLFLISLDEDSPKVVTKLKDLSNPLFNVCSAVFTRDGKTCYFTKNNVHKNKKLKNEQGLLFFGLYKAIMVKGKWTNVTPLSFVSHDFNFANPALSPDDKTLYFVSNMPGTVGLSDIFKVDINEDGTYSNPENLGNAINTEGRDNFPFISDDNELYFSTDGRPGNGGLDVFVVKIDESGNYSEAHNLGNEINSPMDDFAYIIDKKNKKGFFSSNRKGGKGHDDIYSFVEIAELTFEKPDTDEDGVIDELDLCPEESGLVSNNGCPEESKLITHTKRVKKTKSATAKSVVNSKAARHASKKSKTAKRAENITLKPILFDFNKAKIRQTSEIEKTLKEVKILCKQYPNAQITIKGYADNLGKENINNEISLERAKAVRAELLRRGISKNVVIATKGYGESKPVASNKTKHGRAQNRRVEIKARVKKKL